MSKDPEDYVRRIQEEAQRHSQGLLTENERLRLRMAALETDHGRLGEKAGKVDLLQKEIESLRLDGASMAVERQRLLREAEVLREELNQHAKARLELEARLQAAQDESRRFSNEYVEVERQNSNLANLYVASYRLHGTLDRAELLLAIQEIVANLVGSEEMGLFEIDEEAGELALAAHLGIDPERFRRIPLGAGIIGRVARRGETHVTQTAGLDNAGPDEANLTACVPLKVGGRVTGALAVFRLLPQKPSLEPLDHELFDLLADQAAVALYSATLHTRAGAVMAR
jgi:putative methionine-R-sulfoxide reductase with GAF domain